MLNSAEKFIINPNNLNMVKDVVSEVDETILAKILLDEANTHFLEFIKNIPIYTSNRIKNGKVQILKKLELGKINKDYDIWYIYNYVEDKNVR